MSGDSVTDRIRERLWTLADELGWSSLSDAERSAYYERWTRQPDIGGQLAHLMDPRKVRVYIKDSLVKPYERHRLAAAEPLVWRALSMSPAEAFAEGYIKPHGRRMADGRIVCWGNSRDWKLVLMAVFERAWLAPGASPFGAVLLETGKTGGTRARRLVSTAAERLGIERLEWID